MPILILTGPPAAGKNTIAAAVARQLERCAVIDVDLVRWMILQPHRAPWKGEAGKAQQELGVVNTCLLTQNFVRAGYPVVIHDVLDEATTRLYRQALAPLAPRIVLLLPRWEAVCTRAAGRGPRLTAAEMRRLYQQQQQFDLYDEQIDNTELPPDAVAARLVGWLQPGKGGGSWT